MLLLGELAAPAFVQCPVQPPGETLCKLQLIMQFLSIFFKPQQGFFFFFIPRFIASNSLFARKYCPCKDTAEVVFAS